MKIAFSYGDHLSAKLSNVREFNSCQGNSRELTKNQRNVRGVTVNNVVMENCLLLTSRLGLHQC